MRSPVKRTMRRVLQRNVAVVLGNWGSAEAVPVLADALNDEAPQVRGHATWALEQIGSAEAVEAPRRKEGVEVYAWVRKEIMLALRD